MIRAGSVINHANKFQSPRDLINVMDMCSNQLGLVNFKMELFTTSTNLGDCFYINLLALGNNMSPP